MSIVKKFSDILVTDFTIFKKFIQKHEKVNVENDGYNV